MYHEISRAKTGLILRELISFFDDKIKQTNHRIFDSIFFDYFFSSESNPNVPEITGNYGSKFTFRYRVNEVSKFYLAEDVTATNNSFTLNTFLPYVEKIDLKNGDLLVIVENNYKDLNKFCAHLSNEHEIVCVHQIINPSTNLIEVLRESYSKSRAWSKGSLIFKFCQASANTPDMVESYGKEDYNYLQIFQTSFFITKNSSREEKDDLKLNAFLNLMFQAEKSCFIGQRRYFPDHDDYQMINFTTGGLLFFAEPINKLTINRAGFNLESLFSIISNSLDKQIITNINNNLEFDFYMGHELFIEVSKLIINHKLKINKVKKTPLNLTIETEQLVVFGCHINLKCLILGDIYKASGVLLPKNSIEIFYNKNQVNLIEVIEEEYRDQTKISLKMEVGLVPNFPSSIVLVDLI